MIKAVIIAGGTGSRLWPLSRSNHPKQFLRLHDNNTLLQETFNRLNDIDISSSVIICNENHRFFVAEQIRETGKLGSIILEPVGKNTAPAVAIASFVTENDPLLLVLPADHLVQDKNAFSDAINKAIPLAHDGKLVTFGIAPDKPHIGFGYIKKGNQINNGFYVEQFVEKPSYESALDYIQSENYLWNSGIFLFKASRYLEELKKFRPDIYKTCNEAAQNLEMDLDFMRINSDIFNECPSDSIDYAVMEKTKDAIVIPMDVGWNDLGSWHSLWDISKKDKCGNVVKGDILVNESKNCYISSDNKLIVALGINNLIIVDTKDALMVANKDSVQDVQKIAQELKNDKRREWEQHREVYRPWGMYDCIDKGDGYQVKRITVKPGAKLSVQMHNHRAEHWIVVSGIAKVTKGKKTFTLLENESTYISVGEVHSLENPGKVNLELIEVQSGSYLGEDDVVRFEDIYGRLEN